MSSRRHPIYVDGPLEGQDFPADSMFVQAVDYNSYGGTVWSMTGELRGSCGWTTPGGSF